MRTEDDKPTSASYTTARSLLGILRLAQASVRKGNKKGEGRRKKEEGRREKGRNEKKGESRVAPNHYAF